MSRIALGIIIGSVLLNVILALYIFRPPQQTNHSSLETSRTTLPFLSPRVFIQNPNDIIINFMNLRSKLRDYANSIPEPLGVYFEYLPSGVSIGINEKESYVLASLLKVPLVMGIYKRIEEGRLHKTDMLTIQEEHLDPFYGTLWKRGAGTTLSVEELIHLTLTQSDNTAQRVLFAQLPDKDLEDVFDSLDIPKELTGTQPVVTPKNYSSILRSLYLSSYLKEENSNEILAFLTQSPFNDKLAAGIPAEIPVAHKIGVHLGGSQQNEIYTDCGIVYVPKRPYILCMMVKTTEKQAQVYMEHISKIIYDYISQATH